MDSRYRLIIVFAILLSGLALLPYVSLPAEAIGWQRFIGGYDDVVTVTRARWRSQDNELRVRALSSAGGAAQLSVYQSSTNQLIGTLLWDGSEHRNEFILAADPQVITVRSSLGGEATVPTSGDNPPTVTPPPSATASASSTPSHVVPTATSTVTSTVTTTPGATETPTPTAPVSVTASATGTPTAGPMRYYLPLLRR